jgi:hypothetical protein
MSDLSISQNDDDVVFQTAKMPTISNSAKIKDQLHIDLNERVGAYFL